MYLCIRYSVSRWNFKYIGLPYSFDSRFTEAKLEKYYCLLTWCEFILLGEKKKLQ